MCYTIELTLKLFTSYGPRTLKQVKAKFKKLGES